VPVARFDTGTVSSAADLAIRSLLPGIEPGGSRLGHPTKPALLLKDVKAAIIDATAPNAADFFSHTVFLKMSQESSLDPGLRIPLFEVGQFVQEGDATGRFAAPLIINKLFNAKGSVWVPRHVGLQVAVTASFSARWFVWLDYEAVDIPWMDWLIRWDYLDNVVNNDTEW